MMIQAALMLSCLTSAHGIKLLVSSYSPAAGKFGSVQTLSQGTDNALKLTSTNQDCGRLASWLELSSDKKTVTCVNENDPGSLTMLSVNSDGSLKMLSESSALGGPVSSAFFGSSKIALAHYAPPAISTFSISNNAYHPLQNFTFKGAGSGVVPDRQDTAHIHQALLDPSGQYLLFPDLGSDLVRVYCVDPSTNLLAAHDSLKSKPGYGPRHAVFWSPKDQQSNIFLFVVHELASKIVSYSVKYLSGSGGGLEFTQVDEVSTFGDRQTPAGAGAGEILKSPDNAYILASNRLAPIFDLPNPDANNSTKIKSDSIVTFKPTNAGKLEFVELAASGGLTPRHFSLNQDGSKVAVANQQSKSVVVYSRDTASGKMGKQLAAAYGLGPGDLTNVQWLED